MGRANTKENGISCSYVVGRYKEAGNMGGEYTENVFKGSFTKDICNKFDDLIKDIPTDNSDEIDIVNNSDASGESEGNVAGSNSSSSNPNDTEEKVDQSGSPFDENGLQAHNDFRAIHGSTDLKLDSTLSEDAELYAKELSKLGHLKHAQLEDIGENLAYGCSLKDGYELSAAEATKRW